MLNQTIVFLKTYNTDFDDIAIKFKDENGRPWKIEDKGNLALLIKTKKYDKG